MNNQEYVGSCCASSTSFNPFPFFLISFFAPSLTVIHVSICGGTMHMHILRTNVCNPDFRDRARFITFIYLTTCAIPLIQHSTPVCVYSIGPRSPNASITLGPEVSPSPSPPITVDLTKEKFLWQKQKENI